MILWTNAVIFVINLVILVLIAYHKQEQKKRIKRLERTYIYNQYLLRRLLEVAPTVDISFEEKPILDLLVDGNKIGAIKKAMEIYPQYDMKAAKRFVEQLEKAPLTDSD